MERPATMAATLGVYAQDGLAASWPMLATALRSLYRDRVRGLPGVPATWLSGIEAELNAGNLVRPLPTRPHGVPNVGLPAWLLANTALMDAWDVVSEAARLAVFHLANDRREAGLLEVESLRSDARMWDRLYLAAKAIADLPKTVVGAVLDGAESVAGGVLGRIFTSPLVIGGLIVGGGLLAWHFGLFRGLLKSAKA